MRIFAFFFVSLAIFGCVRFPEVEDATGETVLNAKYPKLISLEPFADVLDGADEETLEVEGQLESRVSNLKARADSLRGPALDADERARLQETPQ